MEETDVNISNSTFTNNSVEFGGGINCAFESSPVIVNCTFNENSADYGGGINLGSSTTPSIDSCKFINNTANLYGGGISGYFSAEASILNSEISENHAIEKGGGIHIDRCNLELKHCVIAENTTDNEGGGLSAYNTDSLNVENCTFYSNSAQMRGSGACLVYSNPEFVNNIFSDNLIQQSIYFANSANTSLIYNDFFNNENGDFSGDFSPQLGLINRVNLNGDSCDAFLNIFLDPLFYSTTGDSAFHLTSLSPCIDAGNPLSPPNPDGTIADRGILF